MGHRDDHPPLATEALKALAHPLRMQILDVLSAYGPATASTLAERLGESSGATSYHLRQLAKHGFVSEDPERGSGRERWWQRVPGPIALDAQDAKDVTRRAASQLVMAEWQRSRQQKLQEFLHLGIDALPEEWMEASGVTTSNLQLTREQTAALSKELSEVLTKYIERYRGQRITGTRPVQIHLDVFPLADGVESVGDVSGSEKDEQ